MNKGEIVTKNFWKISVNNTVASINAAVLFFFYDKGGISSVGCLDVSVNYAGCNAAYLSFSDPVFRGNTR